MEHQVLLGAPSLTGKGIHDAVSDAFGGSPFPLTKRITNMTIAPMVFAEVRCFADPFFGEKPFCDVTFKDLGQLGRFLSDVHQIAEIMQYNPMMTIGDVVEVIASVADVVALPVEVIPDPVVELIATEVAAEPVIEVPALIDADGLTATDPVAAPPLVEEEKIEPVDEVSDEVPAPVDEPATEEIAVEETAVEKAPAADPVAAVATTKKPKKGAK